MTLDSDVVELVVGLDGSDQSRMALRWAGTVAGQTRVPVRAVQSWIHPHTALLPIAPEPLPTQAMDDQTEQSILAVVAEVLGPAVAVTPDVKRGWPAAALLETVTPQSALVLGSRGLGGFSGLLLGSVSQECVEYAPCPVVVVRTERTVGAGDVILVGKDGSDGSRRALVWAHALATDTGANVRAVHAWSSPGSERRPRTGERLRSEASNAVQGWTQELDDAIGSEEVEGDPREVLVAAAERLSPALTVVGRRGAGGLRSMRLGSTANHLIRHCSTNVAVVPVGAADR
jgi:nucleotide-binding universal stress UspA family protein